MTPEEAGEAKPDAKELFRELLSVYPSACYEDYFKPPGVWATETLEIDLELIKAHRREAGAPEAIPIEDVEMPDLPKAIPVTGLAGAVAGGQGVLAGTMRTPGAAIKPLASALAARAAGGLVPPGQVGPKPGSILNRPGAPQRPMAPAAKIGAAAGGTLGPSGAAAMSATAAAGPSAELKQIALFIQRWKLEATKAKLLLARLTPARRRYVMSNYKGVTTLDVYIQSCDRTNAWANAKDAPAAATASPGAAAGRPAQAKPQSAGAAPSTAAAAGVKRPLGAPAAAGGGLAKIPRLAGTIGGQAAAKPGPKPPSGAPPPAAFRVGAAASGGGAAPSWAARPGAYGAPAAKPGMVRPVAKPASSAYGAGGKGGAAASGGYGGGAAGGSSAHGAGAAYGGRAAGGYGGYAAAKAPPGARPAGAAVMRPTAKGGPPKAKAGSGSLIKSLLKSL